MGDLSQDRHALLGMPGSWILDAVDCIMDELDHALLGMPGLRGREVLGCLAEAGIVLDIFADAGSPCSRCVPEAVAVPDGLAEARVVSDTVADAASITLYSSSFIYHLYSIVYNPSILRHLPFQIPSSIIHR